MMPTTPAGLDLRRLLQRGERVFPACPQVSRYFPAASIEDARRRLCRAIDRGDGPGLAVGGAGTGKSLLLQLLASQYQERFDVVLLASARVCTRRALLQAMLFELGLPYRLQGEGELRLSLLDHLLSTKNCPSGLLLLVDEAQTLSAPLLDELRVLTNMVRAGAPRVRLVLAGSGALEESFAMPELESFSQRLSSRCYLAPLTRSETCQYIRAQLAAAGAAPDSVISEDALAAVFDATDGVPRLINQLCDRALVIAEANNHAYIDTDLVQAAWSDLQQLPAPWESTTASTTSAQSPNVVEFGSLSDDNDAEPDEPANDWVAGVDRRSPPECWGVASLHPSHPGSQSTVDVKPRRAAQPGDPFAEQFDEEEIVLDSFAAPDDMFWRGMPRVENRRDPGFAGLVQAALDATPACAESPTDCGIDGSDQGAHQAGPSIEEHNQPDNEAASVGLLCIGKFGSGSDEAADEPAQPFERPSLRLADISEPSPLVAIPILSPSPQPPAAVASFDPVFPEASQDAASDWQASLARIRAADAFLSNSPAAECEETAVLVIEDDPPAPRSSKPQVRREEYRHLFSRLRSG
jgi:type II secretory pathway predicted ATPase ExeA